MYHYKKGKIDLTLTSGPVAWCLSAPWETEEFPKDGERRWSYVVKVLNNKTKAYASFKFYTSIHDYQTGKDRMTQKDLSFALYCFVSDALAGRQTFAEFCSEFGYDTDSRQAEKTHQLCVQSHQKACKILSEAELYTIANDERIQ